VRELTLPAREVVRSTPRTRIIHVELGDQEFDFVAGQAVFAGLADGALRRPYSIACSPAQAQRANAIELLVQIDDHNAPDPHLELAEPGTLLRIAGPFGAFSLPPHETTPLLFIAGGTGIAPLRAMMWDTLERTDTSISVLYSARGPEEFAYADELTQLAAEGRIELLRTITRSGAENWPGTRGRLSRELISHALRTPTTRAVICGPSALVADTTRLLQELGLPPDRILTETYNL
jgi:ferredoxin-NADP reductase